MGLNLETLVGILVILILLIMADGLRRMLRERNTRLRMKIEPRHRRDETEAEGSEDRFNPELPSGGARVVQRILEQRAAAEEEAREREQPAQPERPAFRAATQQPLFEAEDEPEAPVHAVPQEEHEEDIPPMRAEREPAPVHEPAPAPVREPVPAKPAARPAARRPEPPPRPEPALLEVIVVHLIAPRGHRFDGRELLQELLESGMRFGEMNIFHCHRHEHGEDVLQFSMANAVEPGTFDIDEMDREQFAGTTFFLKLPGPGRPLAALDRMLDTVRTLAERLGGELKDEQRSVLTPQNMEHMRQRVQEFERRLHLKEQH
ncbi:cell division protein ZipA [Alcanivorax sp. S71-1-4]|uniref:cell division protein ZipA n=1 Tax=Alcanivorax sp. S71-1-4 TaxID=1177159 RepID=UPI0013595393|nr:cell division protein ZipA [Alcanivorax sp. S71-1-4]KAF0810199.1 cell division protein ZipA [Alcanivorax sp. S71-1-4]